MQLEGVEWEGGMSGERGGRASKYCLSNDEEGGRGRMDVSTKGRAFHVGGERVGMEEIVLERLYVSEGGLGVWEGGVLRSGESTHAVSRKGEGKDAPSYLLRTSTWYRPELISRTGAGMRTAWLVVLVWLSCSSQASSPRRQTEVG